MGARHLNADAIEGLATAADDGRVDTLLILGGNPAYDAPADLGFAAALGRVPTTIHLSVYDDETSQLCHWHLPRAHYLESWGDVRAWDGTVSVQQPLIEPLYGGRSPIEVLAVALGERATGGYEIVRVTLGELARAADFEATWRRTLHDGVLAGSAWSTVRPEPIRHEPLDLSGGTPEAGSRGGTAGSVEVVFCPDARVYDGRFANNAWLQELPDPLTKLTWDNAAPAQPGHRRCGRASSTGTSSG